MFKNDKKSSYKYVAPIALMAFVAMILACTSGSSEVTTSQVESSASGTHAMLIDSIPTPTSDLDMAQK